MESSAASPPTRPERAWPIVLLGAFVSLLVYVLLLRVVRELQTAEPSYSGEVFRWVPLLTRESMTKRPDVAALRFLAALLGVFGVYALVLRGVAGRRSRALQAALFGSGALFLFVQLLQPAMLSTDVYSYVMYGRIFGLYHGDPYVKLPLHSIEDPYLPLTYDLPWPSWYGPLWTLVSAGLSQTTGERIGLTVLVFRLLEIGAALAAGGLLWATLRRLAPERAAQGLVFFLWNPLVVLETGMSGHNDAVMAALLLLGIWLAAKGRQVLPIVAFTLSVLVKFVTGLALPLYIVLVLRQLPSWQARLRFLALSGGAAGLTLVAVFGFARAGHRLPVFQAASESHFYENNVQELVFRQARLWLGEEPESVRVPVHFIAYWVTPRKAINVWSGPDASAHLADRLRPGAPLLVLDPDVGERLWVYRPAEKRKGYVSKDEVEKIDRPALAAGDPVVERMEQNPVRGPRALAVNFWLRLLTWTAFAALWLLAAWRATDLRRFAFWSTVVMLASYWLVATETWPWYVIWALALGALVPTSRPAVLAAMLSATVFTLYVTIGYNQTGLQWLYTYRSLPAFVLPLVVFAGWVWAPRLRGSRVAERLEPRPVLAPAR